MAIQTETQVIEFYDDYEEELSQSNYHDAAVKILWMILSLLFRGQTVGMPHNINIYENATSTEPLSPDLAVIDGYIELDPTPGRKHSYYISESTPPPRVVFEMTSLDTWPNDVKLPSELTTNESVTPNGNPHRVRPKQPRYEAMGIKEYFAFDPHQPTVWTKKWKREGRLMGWRLDAEGKYERIAKNEDGWMWSDELSCWLVIEGAHLRLYDENRNRLLTSFEENDLLREKNEIERREREAERRKSEQLEREKEAAERRVEEMAEKLRKLGIDPEA
jgi:hypothetical protein